MLSSLLLFVAAAITVNAFPNLPRQSPSATTIDDTDVLNFALTLEFLESAFYTGALSNFTQEDFLAAGLPEFARGRFEQLASQEAAHVTFLSEVLGENATQPCTYDFPYDSPTSFAALSAVLEGVGVSAYAGAAQFLSNKAFLTAAATVLSTEARHAAFVAAAVNKQNPWSIAFDTPLSLDVIFTIAAQFIVECPSTNPTLPVKAFPPLTLSSPAAGEASTVTVGDDISTDGAFVAFFSGLNTTFVAVEDGEVLIPEELIGTSYAVLTNSNSSATDADITAGVAILVFPFDSNGNPE